MYAAHRKNHIFSLMGCCLLLLLTACSLNTPPTTKRTTPTSTPGIISPRQRFITPTSATTTIAMPPTLTTCPPGGTARAIITAPLALGTHHNIIYTLNEGTYDNPSHGKLIRYDVQTGRKTQLINIAHAHIYEAQASADGQWLLFVTTTGSVDRQTMLQMLRMDGQGLQTLYCATGFSIQQIQWSPDQHFLAFYNVVNEQGIVYLLDMYRGTLQTELSAPPNGGLTVRTWLDATRIYLTDTATDTLFSHIYLLDITKGPHQHLNNLSTILLQQYGDFDSSDDGSDLFISSGGCPQGTCTGPSSITTQAITGGPQRTIYNSQIYDVIGVRVIDHTSLLFVIGNTSDIGVNTDSTHNGLWKINTDGSGLTRLIAITPQQYSYLNYRTQQPWSNFSRDTSMYVFQVNGFQDIVPTNSLLVGSLHGGKPKVFASISDGSQLAMVGWTMM